ncbi:TIGR02444 family protein [Parvularcula sp. ZS-1/3]|uniref:TIGR02444 family protein n=1 Tax=Parvularcula mediterranea TaxID=2732508 RepID=A0A7Y3RNR7_9PROT|nr:TIGR02444 family protein [Parvularcula mediterranea]NNU17476.1 TIGR02444 family protein [Parvularcula mediterranea]
MESLRDYAFKIYGAPGMQETLLALQDRFHVDVNACLWCLWAAKHGFTPSDEDVGAMLDAVEEMVLHTTKPMRSVRRYLSVPRPGFCPDTLAALRKEALGLELKTEEMILHRLDALTQEASEPDETLQDFGPRAQRFFTLAKAAIDMPTMIADEEGPKSPAGLFRKACEIATEHG